MITPFLSKLKQLSSVLGEVKMLRSSAEISLAISSFWLAEKLAPTWVEGAKAVEDSLMLMQTSSSLHFGPNFRCCLSRLKCQLEIDKTNWDSIGRSSLGFLLVWLAKISYFEKDERSWWGWRKRKERINLIAFCFLTPFFFLSLAKKVSLHWVFLRTRRSRRLPNFSHQIRFVASFDQD